MAWCWVLTEAELPVQKSYAFNQDDENYLFHCGIISFLI